MSLKSFLLSSYRVDKFIMFHLPLLVKPISESFRLSPAKMYLLLVTTWRVPASNSWTPPGRVTAVNASPSLSDLVGAALERHRTSVRQLSFLAQKQGFRVTHTTLNQLRAGTYKSTPNGETIRAIAWLAGVSEEIAFTAAGQPVPGPPFAEELPPGVDNLPPKARKAAIDMLRVLVDLNKDADEAEQAERLAARDERRRRLQAAGYVSARQKTQEPDDESTLAAKRRAGKLIAEHKDPADREDERRALTDLSNLDDLKSGERRADEYPDNNIPLPQDYFDLAAHPATESSGRREHEAGRERGEESQEAE